MELADILKELEDRYESRCLRCGRCCGRDSDPCEHLGKRADGKYQCSVYHNRLGPRRTVSGKRFRCVPIQEVKRNGYLPPGCGYR